MDDDPNLLPGAKLMSELPRQRYKVELKPDDINIVSWKKLTKEKAQQTSQSEQKPQPDNIEQKPRNYFSAVLERMENIYRGVDSSDEEGENVGEGGAMDYYDCDDSFIDDSELNEYYKLEKTKSKYSGFYIERRSPEEDKEPGSLPVGESSKKKRKRISMEEIPKKRPKKRVRRMISSPAKEAMNKVMGHDMDELDDTKIKTSMEEIPKKRPKKRVSRMQISSPANEAMDKVVGYDRDELDDSKINKELGSTSTGVLGSDRCKEVGNVRKREKNSMVEIPKKRPKTRASQMQIPSPTNEAMDKAVDRDMDELEDTKINKELGSTSTGVLGSDGCKEVGNVSASNVKDDEPEFSNMLEKAFVDLESAVVESSAQQADMSQVAGSSEGGGSKRRYLPPGVKQRLNEVASLAIAKYGEVPGHISDRLHSILGHIMQRRNLTRWFRRMVKKHDDALQKGTEAYGSSDQDTDALQKTDGVKERNEDEDEDETDEL
ncbi:ubinuclein-1-like [Cryptomeria japonica]|uniref:ubinuclein-1-like n=1 Tax=Cryptomeria japonica TaxID=3369 RepID=UPI0027DA14D0|nr:ubinuclein-1-like [Cryptomeria japonica]